MVRTFGRDERVLGWDVYNEVGNLFLMTYNMTDEERAAELKRVIEERKPERVAAYELLDLAFGWARSADPVQPLTVGVWRAESPRNDHLIELSDVVSFHNYTEAPALEAQLAALQAHGRPVWCTEYMARTRGSTFASHLPVFAREKVGAWNWGLVDGLTQTKFAWTDKPSGDEPETWFHEVFRRDGCTLPGGGGGPHTPADRRGGGVTPLPPDACERLEEDGFLRIEGVLDGAILGRLRDAADRLAATTTAEEARRFRSQGSMHPATADPALADLIQWEPTLDALARLGWPRPSYTDGYVISKPAGSPRLFWHYDWFSWQDERSYEAEPPQLFAMYYLTDTTRANGCLRVIPGSHRRHNPLHDALAHPHSPALSQVRDPDDPAFSDRPDEVDVPVRAGDLVLGDARLLHAAHANGSGDPRSLVTLWYQTDLAALPERMRAQMAAKVQPVPDEWPEPARSKVEDLVARYAGGAEPYGRTLYRGGLSA